MASQRSDVRFCVFAGVVLLFGTLGGLALQSFQEEPSDTAVMIGEAVVVLKCIVTETSGHILWFKGVDFIAGDTDPLINNFPRFSFVGNTSLGEYNLQIENVILEDDGEYLCHVISSEAEIPVLTSRPAKLTIQKIPEPPTIYPSDAILPVVVGVSTNLTCQAIRANPVAEIKWLRAEAEVAATHTRAWFDVDPSGKLMNVASTLILSPTVEDHSLVFVCEVSHMALGTPRKLAVILDVQHAPVVVVESTPSEIREDMTVFFRCVVDANPRSVTYTWVKNDEPISGAEKSQLELLMTKDDHMVSISCTATNAIGSTTGSITLPILYGPRFLEVPVSVSVDEEGPAQMSCSADGNPKPTIKWTRMGSRATLSTMHVLQFDMIRDSDVGTYVCIATVPGFQPIMSYGRVDINAITDITSPSEQKAKIGRKATLQCFTSTKPDPYLVIWSWGDGNELEEGTFGRFTVVKHEEKGGILSELIIDKAKMEDFGVYNCTMMNDVGEDTLLITLVQQGKILVTNLVLSELTIDKAKMEDFGVYNCTMMNDVGEDTLLITLVQQELDLIVWIIIAVIGTSAVIFILTIICMVWCKRKWQRRKAAVSDTKGKVKMEIVRKLRDDDDDYDDKSYTVSYDYNATPPSTPGKVRYAEPQITRGRSDSFDDPYYRAPHRMSDGYSNDGFYPRRYSNNEYSEPIIRKRDDDNVSYHSDRSKDYARKDDNVSRHGNDDTHDNEVSQYNRMDPRYESDTRYDGHRYSDSRYDGDRRYDDERSYEDERSYGDERSRNEERNYGERYSTEGSQKGSDISLESKNKLATNV
ncbi:kin of IRRE-like protein 3 [Asterias rubens]|uniref:kin of IRRE-like protein 3 n=1 Tax=Asterias rubens TaxID=7604 RepID=UPI0014550BE4|nr:kin of IRRE-like protein 3 [Asterias rubens]